MPGLGRYRELLNESERLASGVLVPFAGDATGNDVLNVSADVRPCVVSSETVGCAVLVRVPCSGMIMLESEDASAEVASFGTEVWDVGTVVDEKEE